MGRPKEFGDRVNTVVRIPEELHRRARAVADERDTSVNHLIVKSLAHYLDNVIAPLP